MSDVVHLVSPDHWRARVDAHRSGLSSCAPVPPSFCSVPADCRVRPAACLDSNPHHSFARYLRQDIERPAPRKHSAPVIKHIAEGPLPHLDVPRLGDIPPLERPRTETRVRTVYRIDIPLHQGRVIDILA